MPNAIGRTAAYTTPLSGSVGETYVLQLGDTFEGLVERFGITDPMALAEFRRQNPALAAGRAIAGQVVLLPPHVPSAPVSAPKPGDSVRTSWTTGYNRNVAAQNRYNVDLERARKEWDRLDPLILKSMLSQESGFRARVANRYGYAGIAQLGVREARAMGLHTGSSRMASSKRGIAAHVDRARDERLDPSKAIPAAARLMKAKAAALERGFAVYGRPEGDDYWRFVAAAYNGGEGTVLEAMKLAYGDTPPPSVRWEDLVRSPDGDARHSPLYRAIQRVGMNPKVKYREIGDYARDVVRRARQ